MPHRQPALHGYSGAIPMRWPTHLSALSRSPRRFFQHYGECTNKDCIFLHTRPEEKVADCPWYDRGFCKHGPRCRNRHTRRTLCTKYLAGVCPDGPECKLAHATYGAPVLMPRNEGPAYGGTGAGMGGGVGGDISRRDLSGVTCFKCYEKGHYANHCPNVGRTTNNIPGGNQGQLELGQLQLGRQQQALQAQGLQVQSQQAQPTAFQQQMQMGGIQGMQGHGGGGCGGMRFGLGTASGCGVAAEGSASTMAGFGGGIM
jgi:hypothetical protein